MGRTVIRQRVQLEIDGRCYRVTLTPLAARYYCTVQKMTEFGWRYVSTAQWEHTSGTYTYPDQMGLSTNET